MAYFEANLEVITELWAATQFAIETLVDEAVELVGAVATVVVPVTQQSLVQTFPVTTHESRIVAGPL